MKTVIDVLMETLRLAPYMFEAQLLWMVWGRRLDNGA